MHTTKACKACLCLYGENTPLCNDSSKPYCGFMITPIRLDTSSPICVHTTPQASKKYPNNKNLLFPFLFQYDFRNCMVGLPLVKLVEIQNQKQAWPHQTSFMNTIWTSWWFQPLWKILVKIRNLPQIGLKIWNIWNHHPVKVSTKQPLVYTLHLIVSTLSKRKCIKKTAHLPSLVCFSGLTIFSELGHSISSSPPGSNNKKRRVKSSWPGPFFPKPVSPAGPGKAAMRNEFSTAESGVAPCDKVIANEESKPCVEGESVHHAQNTLWYIEVHIFPTRHEQIRRIVTHPWSLSHVTWKLAIVKVDSWTWASHHFQLPFVKLPCPIQLNLLTCAEACACCCAAAMTWSWKLLHQMWAAMIHQLFMGNIGFRTKKARNQTARNDYGKEESYPKCILVRHYTEDLQTTMPFS